MRKLVQLAIAGVALAWAGAAGAQTTTLRIGNWLPGHHLIPRGIIEPWARAIERESNGSLKLELMPSAIGRPPGRWRHPKASCSGRSATRPMPVCRNPDVPIVAGPFLPVSFHGSLIEGP